MDSKQFQELIVEPTLQEIGLYSKNAVQLLMLTAAQESRLGYYIAQIRGPALGVFQMEPATYADIWENYLKYKPDLASKIQHVASVSKGIIPPAELMVYNLKFAAAMARIHYLRRPSALPEYGNIAAMADYWKLNYNTPLGRGTVKEAEHNYMRYVEV